MDLVRGQKYTIERGDTLTAISQRSGVSIDELVKTNNIADPDLIITGDNLTIGTTDAAAGGCACCGGGGGAMGAPAPPAADLISTKKDAKDGSKLLNAPVETAGKDGTDRESIIRMIREIAPKFGADAKLMIADAIVESGLRPDAVGDGGTSFGLFQDHIGGAGGRTKAEASQYLNARKSIEHAAQRFAGKHTAEDAYQVQRPADHAGYVRKVQDAMNGL